MNDNAEMFSVNKNTSEERQLAGTFGEVLKAAWKGLLIAVVCSVALVLLFALLADKVFDKGLVNTDNGIALWSYSLTNPVLTFILTIITEIGSPLGIAILTVLAFGFFVWRKKYAYACLVALTSLGSAIINETLKLIFHRVRPDLLPGGPHLTSYSFPSGHATGSICFFGFLIWASWKLLKNQPLKIVLTAALSLMILLVGFSRVYLGFHFPTDVLGAYLSGGCWLIALLSSYNLFYRYRHFRPKGS